jgi:hypothetical protein
MKQILLKKRGREQLSGRGQRIPQVQLQQTVQTELIGVLGLITAH